MYQPLVPCASCRRHVRAADATCPFCRSVVAASPLPELALTERLSRGGIVAFAALAMAGCQAEPAEPTVAKDPATTATAKPTATAPPTLTLTPPPPPPEKPSDVDDHGTMASKYGAPPPPKPAPPPKPTATPTTTAPHVGIPAYGLPPPPPPTPIK